MANVCAYRGTHEYQKVAKHSGIHEGSPQEQAFDAEYLAFKNDHGRAPYSDEIVNINVDQSIEDLSKSLKMNKNGGVKTETLLEETGTTTAREALIELNNRYRHLDIYALPLNKETYIEISKRPSQYMIQQDLNNLEDKEIFDGISNIQVFNEALDKLTNRYGIQTKFITTEELLSNFQELTDDLPFVKAFVLNGDIYINVDNASVDSKLHEITHLLIGSLRFKNAKLYQNLVNSVENIPNYQELYNTYKNRSRNDINEEIFVDQISKYYTGQESVISKLNNNQKYELEYNINRVLDTILMGDFSTNSIPVKDLFNLSLKDVAKLVNSALLSSYFSGTLTKSEVHRINNNIKSDLMKKGELKEYCD